MAAPRVEQDYPPKQSEEEFATLIQEVKDWQITHGSLLKLVRTDEEHTILSRPIGVSLYPSLFPKDNFSEAQDLQKVFNELYATMTEDEGWLDETLRDIVKVDPFAAALWDVHLAAKQSGYAQDLTLGLFRSDYMLHWDPSAYCPRLKQVEFNTYSVAGGSHSNYISNMHKHLHRSGAYTSNDGTSNRIAPSALPRNHTIESLARGLALAHTAYGAARNDQAGEMAVLFIVQPHNVNVCDERPLEYALWNRSPPIPAYRLEWGSILPQTTLTSSMQLLFYPRNHSRRGVPLEISVVYFRAGYEPAEYDAAGCAARLRLEQSRAIKCPSILAHLTTFKKVQQALTLPRNLERFISTRNAARIRETFAPMYPLDDSALGLRARRLASDPSTAVNHVLKPSLEGGGHNVYGEDIPNFLAAVPKWLWHQYILMERIDPPDTQNTLMSLRGLYSGAIISELGVFGVCLWRRRPEGNQRPELVENFEAGFSFKSKAREVTEMSVVKGYGCFDSPCLL